MAKNRTDPTPKPRGRPKSANPKPPTPIVVTIRARAEWEQWMDLAAEELRKRTGLNVKFDRTEIIDAALNRLAAHLELPPPPPRY